MRGRSIKFTSVLKFFICNSQKHHSQWVGQGRWGVANRYGLICTDIKWFSVTKRLGPLVSQITHLAIDLLFQMETTCQLMTWFWLNISNPNFCRDGGDLPAGDRPSLSCRRDPHLQSFSCQQCNNRSGGLAIALLKGKMLIVDAFHTNESCMNLGCRF